MNEVGRKLIFQLHASGSFTICKFESGATHFNMTNPPTSGNMSSPEQPESNLDRLLRWDEGLETIKKLHLVETDPDKKDRLFDIHAESVCM
jgi:hypothetical protein